MGSHSSSNSSSRLPKQTRRGWGGGRGGGHGDVAVGEGKPIRKLWPSGHGPGEKGAQIAAGADVSASSESTDKCSAFS